MNKNISSSLFLQKLFIFTGELTYMCYTAESQEERLFSTRQHSYFGVTHFENQEVLEMKHATGMETRAKIYLLFIFNLV